MKSDFEILYDYCVSMVGLPYHWGGDDTIDGFDCSGLVIHLLQSAGVLPRRYDNTARGLFEYFSHTKKLTDRVDAEFGCLCFYGKSTLSISHVGFALNERLMLEAGGGNSKTKSKEMAARQNAFVRIAPIRARNDLVAILMPPYAAAKAIEEYS